MPSRQQATRLGIRLTPENKSLILRAAEALGVNLSAFTVVTLVREARRVVESRTVVRLNDVDRDAFLAMLENPPAPNRALLRAARRHREGASR